MGKKEEEQKVAFNLVVDKNRAKVMNLLLDGYEQLGNGAAEILMKSMQDEGIEEDFLSLIDELSVKVHEFGWCEDPDCEEEQGG